MVCVGGGVSGWGGGAVVGETSVPRMGSANMQVSYNVQTTF